MVGVDITFEEIVDILLPSFDVNIYDYNEMRAPNTSADLYKQLLKTEIRHGTDRAGVPCNKVQRETRSIEFKHFLSREFRNEGMKMIFQKDVGSFEVVREMGI